MKRAAWLLFVIGGCGPNPERPPGASHAPPPSASVSPVASVPPVVSAEAIVSAAPVSDANAPPIEMPAEALASLTEKLQSRRVFRHLKLGNMPVRERTTWLLSDDNRELTLTCEREADGRIESGSPVPKRWFVVATATFVTSEAAAGIAWAANYRRSAVTQVRYAPATLCAALGDALALDCKSAEVRLHSRGAFVPVETRREEPVRWKPSALRAARGLGCDAKADGLTSSLDGVSSTSKQPMLFFSEKTVPVERLVHSDAVQYEGFREATLTSFDGSLPEHLRKR